MSGQEFDKANCCMVGLPWPGRLCLDRLHQLLQCKDWTQSSQIAHLPTPPTSCRCPLGRHHRHHCNQPQARGRDAGVTSLDPRTTEQTNSVEARALTIDTPVVVDK